MNKEATKEYHQARVSRRPAFWRVSMKVTQLAVIVDISFFFIFYALDSFILAWFNVISVAMYFSAYVLLKKKKNQLAAMLIWTEVAVHAGLGVILTGWNSGHHYYLLLFIPAFCLSLSRHKAILVLLAWFGYYVTLSMLNWASNPIQPINPLALTFVHTFNLSAVFAMFSYLSFFYLGNVKKAQKQLHEMATTDPLTTLYNRRHLSFLADIEIERAKANKNSFCLMLIDIDLFKAVNDSYGHDVGDSVLVCIADILKAKMRKEDIIARWGGEEFLIILPKVTKEEARKSAERVQAELAAFDWVSHTGVDLETTISAGISYYKDEEALSEAIARADDALYQSKANGRNRIELEVRIEGNPSLV